MRKNKGRNALKITSITMSNIRDLQSQLEYKKRDRESYQRDYDKAAASIKSNPSDSSAEHNLERAKDQLKDVDEAIKRLENEIRSSV